MDESDAKDSSLPEIRLAKIDGTTKPNRTFGRNHHKIKELPTLVFYKDGKYENYTGGIEQE